jgi:hypothetical protein
MIGKFFQRILITLVILSAAVSYHLVAAQESNLMVSVVGFGPTYDEAKADAVKKALQYAFKQLVIVDRIVSGNDLLRDRILSTSNGYIE